MSVFTPAPKTHVEGHISLFRDRFTPGERATSDAQYRATIIVGNALLTAMRDVTENGSGFIENGDHALACTLASALHEIPGVDVIAVLRRAIAMC